jgi:hypothetical protein
MEEKTEANRWEFHAQTLAEWASRLAACMSADQPQTFNGNASWSMFWHQYKATAEHNQWSYQVKLMYLITALKGQVADVLHSILTNTTYKETLQALEDRFGDQHFAAAYRCQLTRTQKAGESLQHFAMAIEQLAYRAYSTLPEDHIRREAGKVSAYGVKDPDIKIELLLGGEKTVNKALRQAVLIAARLHQNNTKTYWGNQSPPNLRKNALQSGCWSYWEPGHFESNCHYGSETE